MMGALAVRTAGRYLAIVIPMLALGCATAPAPAPDVPASDLLNAVLWMQRSVEYRATALEAFALARIRLDQALTDPNWTAAPKEQTGAYQSLPPAIVLDADESILDNSAYQAWMALNAKGFDAKTWNAYVNTVSSRAIPGAVEFARYAAGKGVKVFYVTNRTAAEAEPTRVNLEKLGFPLDASVDTVLATGKQADWGSAKGARRAFIARSYRILINVGDNLGDFVDDYRGTEAERLTVMEQNKERWGREWIMIANPSYGSFESAPFKHDFKLSEADRRKAKRGALDAWPGP
jgi:acid phosphatase